MTAPIQLFVGDHWLVFHGPSFDTELHRHHAAQWAYVAEGKLSVQNAAGNVISGQGLFVPPDQIHAFSSVSEVVMVYWEAEHDLVRGYMSRESGSEVMSCAMPEVFSASWTAQKASELAYACVRSSLENSVAKNEMDSRVYSAQHLIKKHLDRSLSLEAVASEVHISGAHLARLFRSQAGTTFRAFVRWCRLRRAVEMALAGHQLIDAAHESGFSDSAHFSRTFREMFGVAPQFLFGRRDLLEVHIVD